MASLYDRAVLPYTPGYSVPKMENDGRFYVCSFGNVGFDTRPACATQPAAETTRH